MTSRRSRIAIVVAIVSALGTAVLIVAHAPRMETTAPSAAFGH